MLLSWGAKPLAVDVSGFDAQVLSPDPPGPWLEDPRQALDEALDSPDGLPSLARWLHGARRVAVVLPHEGHPLARSSLVRFIVQRVRESVDEGAKVRLFSACASSAPLLQLGSGRGVPDDPETETVSHDPRDGSQLRVLGEVGQSGARSLAEGVLGEVVRVMGGQSPSRARAGASAAASRRRIVAIHKVVQQADRIVAPGFVFPHPVLGYTGAGSTVVPGVADGETVRALQELAVHPVCGAGRVEGNTARNLVMEALALLGDRLLCVDLLAADEDRVAALAAGRPRRVLDVMAPLARTLLGVSCTPSRSVVASAPARDLESLICVGALAVSSSRTAGTLLIVGQCPDGIRDPREAGRILEHVLMGRMARGQVMVYTSLPPRELIRCGLRPVRSVPAAFRVMRERASGDDHLSVLPDCSRVLLEI